MRREQNPAYVLLSPIESSKGNKAYATPNLVSADPSKARFIPSDKSAGSDRSKLIPEWGDAMSRGTYPRALSFSEKRAYLRDLRKLPSENKRYKGGTPCRKPSIPYRC